MWEYQLILKMTHNFQIPTLNMLELSLALLYWRSSEYIFTTSPISWIFGGKYWCNGFLGRLFFHLYKLNEKIGYFSPWANVWGLGISILCIRWYYDGGMTAAKTTSQKGCFWSSYQNICKQSMRKNLGTPTKIRVNILGPLKTTCDEDCVQSIFFLCLHEHSLEQSLGHYTILRKLPKWRSNISNKKNDHLKNLGSCCPTPQKLKIVMLQFLRYTNFFSLHLLSPLFVCVVLFHIWKWCQFCHSRFPRFCLDFQPRTPPPWWFQLFQPCWKYISPRDPITLW